MLEHRGVALILILNLKWILLLPWVSVAIVIERIPYAKLGTIHVFIGSIFGHADSHSVDLMYLQKVQPPPRVYYLFSNTAGSRRPFGVIISINGFLSCSIIPLAGLSGNSSLCNVLL